MKVPAANAGADRIVALGTVSKSVGCWCASRVNEFLRLAVRSFIALAASGRATDWPGGVRTDWRSPTYTAYWIADVSHVGHTLSETLGRSRKLWRHAALVREQSSHMYVHLVAVTCGKSTAR
jgi:hypothetical protein